MIQLTPEQKAKIKEVNKKLKEETKNDDAEMAHINADKQIVNLLKCLGLKTTASLYDKVEKWYS